MSNQQYQLSPHLHIITDSKSGTAMVYHTLYGNPRLVNNEGMKFLEIFRNPMSTDDIMQVCDNDPTSVIQEFARIYFFVEPGFDERAFLRSQRSKHLQNVQAQKTVDRMGLAISDLCNFSCAHCIHRQASQNNGRASSPHEHAALSRNMTWETAKKCIDHYVGLIRKRGKTKCKIHFGNAEPLINWKVLERVLSYCQGLDDVVFEYAINTNLVLMTREMAYILKKYHVKIATSLDGTAKANDAIRITGGKKGTFNRILEKFDLLDGVGYPLDGFSITVTDGNFDLIGTDVIDLAVRRGMTSIAFDYDLVGLVDVPVTVKVDRLMALKKYANQRGIDFFGTWDSAFRNLTSESLLFGNHAFCAAVEGRSLEFNVDGSIKVCSHVTKPIGHVDKFDQMFEEGGSLFQMVRERFPGTDQYCSGCAIEGACAGQCHVTREAAENLTVEKRQSFFAEMCDFYRLVTETLAIEYIRSNKN